MSEIPGLLTLHEVADELGVEYSTACRYVRVGRLPHLKVGYIKLVPADALGGFELPRVGNPNFKKKATVEPPRKPMEVEIAARKEAEEARAVAAEALKMAKREREAAERERANAEKAVKRLEELLAKGNASVSSSGKGPAEESRDA